MGEGFQGLKPSETGTLLSLLKLRPTKLRRDVQSLDRTYKS